MYDIYFFRQKLPFDLLYLDYLAWLKLFLLEETINELF